jgi:hypothetical protein
MVTELKELLRRTTESAPPDHLDLDAVMSAGRSRVRRRRLVPGGAALASAGIMAVGWPLLQLNGTVGASAPPRPDAPTISLAAAQAAVEGQDYEVLTSLTNRNLDEQNGRYLDGVTDDGLVLVEDGARGTNGWEKSFALRDPATGETDELPDPGIGSSQTWPVELSTERLVLIGVDQDAIETDENAPAVGLVAHVFDRQERTWSTMQWADLPAASGPAAVLGPDGRLYVLTPATQGRVPEGGWPVGPDGDADDAGAEGDTHHLWSVSLTDTSDVRDEHLVVGDVAFTDDAMVWTDSANGAAGLVHVRDLATGEEHAFDPHLGDRCNLLGFGATGDRIVMSQYCGTYETGRDDRVQIISTEGDQVVTLQGDGIEGWLPAGSDVVNVTVFGGDNAGTYAYDLPTERFLKISNAVSNYSSGGPTDEPEELFWHTPANDRHGSTQWLGRLLP